MLENYGKVILLRLRTQMLRVFLITTLIDYKKSMFYNSWLGNNNNVKQNKGANKSWMKSN